MMKNLLSTFAAMLFMGGSALSDISPQNPLAGQTPLGQYVGKTIQLAKKHDHKGHGHEDHKESDDKHEGHDHEKHKDKDKSDHKPHHGEKGHKHKDDDDHKGHDHKNHKDEEKSDHKPHHGEKGHKHKDDDDHKGHDHEKHKDKEKSDHKPHHGEKGHKHKDDDDHKKHNDDDEHNSNKQSSHEDHDAHGSADKVQLSKLKILEFGIKTDVVKKGDFSTHLKRPAEVKFDQDSVAHIVSRVSGIARKIFVAQGDKVSANQLMAVLDSRELAEVRTKYMTTSESAALMTNIFTRAKNLRKKEIMLAREYLETKKKYSDILIDKKSAAQKILAIGFPRTHLKELEKNKQSDLSEYRLVSPFSGTVIERKIVRGEAVSRERQVFVIADLSRVWVDVSVYLKDLSLLKENQTVHIVYNGGEVDGKIAFITPYVNETTRTATARIIVENADQNLRPGMFLEVQIETAKQDSIVRISKEAIQNSDKGKLVFVAQKGAFFPRPVKLGRVNHKYVEVISGLKPGETYVQKGAFTLKAQLAKGSFDDGHNH